MWQKTAVILLLLLTLIPFANAAPQQSDNHDIFLPLIRTPQRGNNLLPNGSFEGFADCQVDPNQCWYHPDGIAELQIPVLWTFRWEEGPTGFGDQPWDVWVRPEVRVLSPDFLPPHEHDLFIWDGDQTLKVFKGYGAISYLMTTEVRLEPGTYQFEIYLFPDLVDRYENGQKVWAPDPLSGEVKLIAPGSGTTWQLPAFGEKNRFRHTFTLQKTTTIQLGAEIRGRFALQNNGWFLDEWGVYRLN